jgi:hypothetical protein
VGPRLTPLQRQQAREPEPQSEVIPQEALEGLLCLLQVGPVQHAPHVLPARLSGLLLLLGLRGRRRCRNRGQAGDRLLVPSGGEGKR